MYSDSISPYCSIGTGLVGRWKREFPITERWLQYEIHPDTPKKGLFWANSFPGMNLAEFFQQLDARGTDLGVRFGPQMLMRNSREPLEGGGNEVVVNADEQGRRTV